MAASMIGAFMECSPTIQAVVLDMIAIINSDDSDPDDVDAALNTLIEALFHEKTAQICEQDEALFNSPQLKAAAEEIESEHAHFATRVRQLMEEKGVTQAQLAHEANITQPAVSNLLNRHARPQRRTVSRFAAALGVSPEELWPTKPTSVPASRE